MTEQTIRIYAKELAADWYDKHRVARREGFKIEIRDPVTGRLLRVVDPILFCKTYPTLRDYWGGRKHGYMATKRESSGVEVRYHVDDGKIYKGVPGWALHYDRARKQLTHMLGLPHVSENIKEGIYKALMEDRQKQWRHEELGHDSPFWAPGIPQIKAIDAQ